MKAVIEQAEEDSQKVLNIQKLYERIKTNLPGTIGAQFVLSTLEAVFRKPVFSTTDFVHATGIARRSALRVLSALKEAGVLSTLKPAVGRQPDVLVFGQLVDAAEGRKVE